MQIVKSSFEILTPIKENAEEIYKTIERAARTCYKSEDKIADGSAARLIKGLINSHHEAMLEHASITVKFTVDRGISHELVRHRLASFAQTSTRYVNYNNDKFGKEIIYIDIDHAMSSDYKIPEENREAIYNEWQQACEECENHYMKMIELGCSPQIARGVLNNSTSTDIVVTANIREWRHILNLRAVGTTGAPHPQMKEIMDKLLDDFIIDLPVLFEDLRQNKN